MVPVFSAGGSEGCASSTLEELVFLQDQELMSLWEQTQLASMAIEAHGGNSNMAHIYEQAVLIEMMRRQASRPMGSLFGTDWSEAFAAPAEKSASVQ
jgi:hypothetical protein